MEHPEGDVLDHVREHQPLYLGCVFSVVREWYRQGRPRTNETRHDFKRWARSLDGIVQSIFQSAPLLDGRRETQKRMVNPVLNWVRDVGIVVCSNGHAGKWLRAHQLPDMLANTDVELPGVSEADDLDSDDVRNKVLPSIGRKMGKEFGAEMSLQIDYMFIEKRKAWYDLSRKRYEYRFTKVDEP